MAPWNPLRDSAARLFKLSTRFLDPRSCLIREKCVIALGSFSALYIRPYTLINFLSRGYNRDGIRVRVGNIIAIVTEAGPSVFDTSISHSGGAPGAAPAPGFGLASGRVVVARINQPRCETRQALGVAGWLGLDVTLRKRDCGDRDFSYPRANGGGMSYRKRKFRTSDCRAASFLPEDPKIPTPTRTTTTMIGSDWERWSTSSKTRC